MEEVSPSALITQVIIFTPIYPLGETNSSFEDYSNLFNEGAQKRYTDKYPNYDFKITSIG